ncbi:hypothetical protein KYN89_12460 [Alteriqipengyuania sp. NZ-12B]|uniref:DUF6468 domain-containing protein n=1 Tax=Alteriqipengyuania abyssalis TaxID=2860200 RepID=A0ABS7PI10_9SPHN|nr:DUF6468 domain-containing protein [Alteriqipengyuania abyssalis]MBY8337855.1 hypothetical protein [Alteriqipengyuania abyssalis]
MSFTVFTNVITVLFCIAVLIQSVRMMRSLKDVREGQLDRTVGALDTATAKAQGVLSELKQTLSVEGAANARALGDAREVREELHLMIGIANAMAERLMEAASVGSAQETKVVKAVKESRPARVRSAKPTQPKADMPKATRAAPAKIKSAASTSAMAPSAKAPSGKTPSVKSTTAQAAAATAPAAKAVTTKKTPARTSRKGSTRTAGAKEAA